MSVQRRWPRKRRDRVDGRVGSGRQHAFVEFIRWRRRGRDRRKHSRSRVQTLVVRIWLVDMLMNTVEIYAVITRRPWTVASVSSSADIGISININHC